jgi:hypothetical protein
MLPMVRMVVALVLMMVFSVAAQAEKRVALVVGNSAYKHAGTLSNPKNDADDMAAALKALDIEVIKGLDLDKAGLEREVRKFSAALSGADVGIFFYAGHGLQVNGNNYLVPVDAELSSADALEFEMVRLDLVQRIMEGNAKTNILFLDACRNNPLVRNLARALGTRSASIGRGLAAAESGVGTLISFSTQPGNVALDGTGRNSPYTGPLVKRIGRPGDDVLTVLTDVRNEVLAATADKQVPWENHALRARYYFNQASTAAVPTVTRKDTQGNGELPVFRCGQAPANRSGGYGIGVLTTHPQFCAQTGPAEPSGSVPASIAMKSQLIAGGLPVFVCKQFATSLFTSTGIGVLTTHPQYCRTSGQSPAPGSVAPSIANDTGLMVGAAHVFRCSQFSPNLNAANGIGVLTTHPQFCATSGLYTPPAMVPSNVAPDAGLRVR